VPDRVERCHPVLITQRSQVQILPPLPGQRPGGISFRSLQKIRRALDALRVDLGLRDHLSSYQLVADGSTIYLADSHHAVDLLRLRGNLVIHQFVEVLEPFYVQGRQIPALLEPREHVEVDPAVRGGEPVIAGTRIPYDEVAALLRDGVAPERSA